nr:HAMP domain-containing sensor histidine kinase [uncultured Pseudodesulfovibrio sp.]
MTWSTILACVLIFLGALVMLRSIMYHKNLMFTVQESIAGFSKQTSGLVKIHMAFMVFFFFAYLVVIFFFMSQIDVIDELVIGLIFIFGAIFVYTGIIIQRRAFDLLNNINIELREYAGKLEENQETLLHLNENLKQEIKQKEMAQQSEQLKSDFLSQVSHELRTPLTSIFGFTKLIKKDFDSISSEIAADGPSAIKKDRIWKNISIIICECSRLTRMINNVLDLAKIESGQATWNDKPTLLKDVIESSVTAVEGLLLEKASVSLKIDTRSSLPSLYIDADLITQVMVNLLSNAIKFTDSGEITIETTVSEDTLVIAVCDEGVGMSSESLDRIFDRYYVARNGNTLSSSKLGTGLGLPICKEIIEHYKGEILAESEFGKGSCFYVTLPLSMSDE